MGFDIALLQQLYGANMDFATGDDTYEIADENVSGTFFACIWDYGGIDEMSYSGARNVLIDLRAAHLGYAEGSGGFISFAKGIYGGFTIANGVVIENATGGSGRDLIKGNDNCNALSGNDGLDVILGLGGKDSLDGGAGSDVLTGGAAADQLDGGNGADLFLYLSRSDSRSAKGSFDKISGFVSGSDVIDLTGIDAIIGNAGKDGFIWIDSDRFNDVKGELRWSTSAAGVVVSGDFDGDGAADFRILLADIGSVTLGDFVL